MPLTIAITGALGQIGKATTSLALAQGHKVLALDALPPQDTPDGVTYTQVDLTSYPAFLSAAKGADALIHLAATYSLQDHDNPDGPLLRHIPEHVRAPGEWRE